MSTIKYIFQLFLIPIIIIDFIYCNKDMNENTMEINSKAENINTNITDNSEPNITIVKNEHEKETNKPNKNIKKEKTSIFDNKIIRILLVFLSFYCLFLIIGNGYVLYQIHKKGPENLNQDDCFVLCENEKESIGQIILRLLLLQRKIIIPDNNQYIFRS